MDSEYYREMEYLAAEASHDPERCVTCRSLPPAIDSTLYIAGPMTGYEEYNFPAFYEVEEKLREQGYQVVNPARVDDEQGTPEGFSYDDADWSVTSKERQLFLRRDFQLLLECDGIVLLPGWSESLGANAELAVARMAGLLIYRWVGGVQGLRGETDLLPEWDKVQEAVAPYGGWHASLPSDRTPLSRLEAEADLLAALVAEDPWDGEGPSAAEEAEDLVRGARQADYGHPLDDFSKTALFWQAILGHPVTPEQVALCMVGVKISREVNKPKRDNIVDAHGYLLTYEMVGEERDRRAAS